MRKKNIIIIAFAALLIIFLGVSCNDDPRVAPSRLYIVNDPNCTRGFTYDENGMRVLYLRVGEFAILEAYTNRSEEDIGKVTWSSSDPVCATIDPDTGYVRVLSRLHDTVVMTATTDDGHLKAYAYVKILNRGSDLPGDAVDPNIKLNIVVPATGDGFTVDDDGRYVRYMTKAEIGKKSFPISIGYDPGEEYEIIKYVWYLDGKVIHEGLETTHDVVFSSYGTPNLSVACHVSPKDTSLVSIVSSNVDFIILEAM